MSVDSPIRNADGDDDDARITSQVDQAVRKFENLSEREAGPLEQMPFLGKLACGCVHAGKTRARVRLGSHGSWCPEHEKFSLFVDAVSARPQRDRNGKR